MKKNKNIVKLLTAAALALPTSQPALAESPPAMTRAEFGYGTYDESGNRYNINVYQSKITAPVTEKTSISIQTMRDLQTGASFVFAEPQSFIYIGANNPGNPSVLVPVYSGASITEVRDSINVGGSYYFPDSILSIGYRYSTEDDYLSHSADVEWRQFMNKKNTELAFGLGYSDDQIHPTLAANVPNRSSIESNGSKSIIRAVVGIRQDWSPKATTQFGVGYDHARGYLADPYKRVMIYGNAVPVRPGSSFIGGGVNIPAGLTIDFDRRPGQRETWSVLGKFIYYFEKANSSIQAQYQYAHNDWDIGSSTLEASYHQPFGASWRVIPLMRYYTQSEAYFYSYMFAARGGAPFPAKLLPVGLENSCDYRLSKLGTLNSQISLNKKFPADIELDFIGGIYMSREWLHLGSDPEVAHPAVNYTSTYFAVNVAIDFA